MNSAQRKRSQQRENVIKFPRPKAQRVPQEPEVLFRMPEQGAQFVRISDLRQNTTRVEIVTVLKQWWMDGNYGRPEGFDEPHVWVVSNLGQVYHIPQSTFRKDWRLIVNG